MFLLEPFKPCLKDLQRHVIPYVATKWYELGLELFDTKKVEILDTIEHNYNNNAKKCCLQMFRIWLKTERVLEWDWIVNALKSPGVDLNSLADGLEQKLLSM